MSTAASSPRVRSKKRYADNISQTATAGRGRRSATPKSTLSASPTASLQQPLYMMQQQQQQAYYPWFYCAPPPPPLSPCYKQPPQHLQQPYYPQQMMMWTPPSLPHRQNSRPALAPSSSPPLSASCSPAPPPSPPSSSGRRSPRQKLHMDLTEIDQDDTIPLAMLAHKLCSPPPSPASSTPHAKQVSRCLRNPGSVNSNNSRPGSRNKMMMSSPGGSRPSSPSRSCCARPQTYGRGHHPSAPPPPPAPPPNLTPVARSASVPTRETKHTSYSSDISEKGSEKKPSSIMSKAKRLFGIRRRTSSPT
ncbi:hypothetical protein BCR43DRAFT_487262 [Syncephalastrum racemosum]|uniref:Uncharacterized protein n=1 Tax=Syncephalastrum racemosum TaxID=13706 RepID=A0A1X2HRX4_SYNRA|nr:hypothetical protein BCR43DRAFT_487262 [Syncephalastrum racemosum]